MKKLKNYQRILLISIVFVCVLFSVRYAAQLWVAEKPNNPNRGDDTEKKQELNLSNQVEITSNYEKNEVKTLESFILKGWGLLRCDGESAIAEGDLNGDEIPDKAFVIEKEESDTPDYKMQRNLVIIFGNTEGSYDESITVENAILLSDEGGPFGDPFQALIIERGSLLLKFMGGSAEKWDRCFRFRYQDRGWYLIGFTEGRYEAAGDAMERLQNDYN